jgi:amino acid transporter
VAAAGGKPLISVNGRGTDCCDACSIETAGNEHMQQSLSAQRAAVALEGQHALPARHWHAKGYQVSIFSSLLMTVVIGLFFIAMAGWSPPESWQEAVDFTVTWILLTYIWVQMGSLILVGAGTKNQMWLDALTSIVPLFLITYVVIQHYSGYVVLSSFQVKTAWVTVYTMLLDVVIDLGVSVLLSRQVVDVGSAGVG